MLSGTGLGTLADQLFPGLAFTALLAALVVGGLLTIRVRPGTAGSSLLLVPLLVAFARLDALALLPLTVAAAVVTLVRSPGPKAAAIGFGSVVGCAAIAALAAFLGPGQELVGLAIFGAVFTACQIGIARIGGALRWPAGPEAAAWPERLVVALIAPVAILPIVVGAYLGDGALLLSLGALLAMLLVVREAVNLATARAEVEAERDRLLRSNELQDELTQLIVHDVKNPLTAVIGYASLARTVLHSHSATDDRIEKYLGHVERAGRSIEQLVDNLLHLKRFEASAELPPPEPADVATIAGEVVGELEPLAQEREQTMVLDVPVGTPPVLASPMLLREALANLVSNAVKYTPRGGNIRIAAGPGEAETVAIAVTDTGVGLSTADQERLFTRYFRSDDPRVGTQRGSGLGLALTRSVIERMGGRITVESTLNRGTTFAILLPAAARQG